MWRWVYYTFSAYRYINREWKIGLRVSMEGWGLNRIYCSLFLFLPACVWRHTTHSDLLCHSAFRKWKHDRIKWQFKKNLTVACVRVPVTPGADIYTPNSDPYRRPWGRVINNPKTSSLCLINAQATRTYCVEDRESNAQWIFGHSIRQMWETSFMLRPL